MDLYTLETGVRNAGSDNTVITVNGEDAVSVLSGPADTARLLQDIDVTDAPSTGVSRVDGELRQMQRLHKYVHHPSLPHLLIFIFSCS